jgi:hypothetical protein
MRIKAAWLLAVALFASQLANAGTVTGFLQVPSGLPVKNATLTLTLSQAGIIIGSGSIVPASIACYTSIDGHVTGLPDVLTAPTASVNALAGTLPAGTYYVRQTFYNGTGESLPSPELPINVPSGGTLTLNAALNYPANATGVKVYIGTAAGAETLQGTTTGNPNYAQSVPLVSGTALPNTNSSICTLAFNDTIIPYSGYSVALLSNSGNAYPGWPQQWQLNGGPSGTVNVSQGAPLWDGTVVYPMPILAQPLNHGVQSISGPLNFGGYNVIGVGALGVGTPTPSWPIDVENGPINTNEAYLINGSYGTANEYLASGGPDNPDAWQPLPTLHYQCFALLNSCAPREPAANFTARFTLTDVPGNETTVDLNAPGTGNFVATETADPGTTTNVAAYDGNRNLVPSSVAVASLPTYKAQFIRITSGICTVTGGEGVAGGCPMTAIAWPNSSLFADGNYALTCSPGPISCTTSSNCALAVNWTAKTATTFSLLLVTGSNSAAGNATTSEIDCWGAHL